jgi:hypothetical protein
LNDDDAKLRENCQTQKFLGRFHKQTPKWLWD